MDKNTKNFNTCWIVTEGIAGTENQCIGVAEALGLEPEIKRISLNFPWNILSPYLRLESKNTFKGNALKAPWPDIVIAAGRKAIAAARYIKKQSGGKTFICFLQDPRVKPDFADLFAVPHHDNLRGDNVIVTSGAPNRITEERIQSAAGDLNVRIDHIPHPHVAVLIGGNSRTHTMGKAITKHLAEQILALAENGFGVMVTASRRTGAENMALLQDMLKHKNIFFWDGTGENPYFGFLGLAQYIIVTEDSVSMVSDAATTGKPFYIVKLSGDSPKFQRFYANLFDKKIGRWFRGTLEDYSYIPVRDAEKIAQEIKKRAFRN